MNQFFVPNRQIRIKRANSGLIEMLTNKKN